MVGIKDIAKVAGVSISTVSYALNGSSKVTERTRQKIMTIANEMNYVPNMAARTLKRQQTNIIGVYLTDYGGSFYGELLDGMKKGLELQGYEMIVCSGKQSQLFIPERMIDGAIILDWSFQSDKIVHYANQGHQIVVLDRELESKNIHKILLDNVGGTCLAIEHFALANASKVYLIAGPEKGYDSQKRLQTSQKELKMYGIDYEIIQGNFIEASGTAAAEEIMQHNPTFPLYIFALNDEMAIGIYEYFKNSSLKIGEDIRIIGFDNIEVGKFLLPRLATISYSKHRWGMLAAQVIIQMIKQETIEAEQIYTTYVAGGSFPER
ncbi:LacI family transcriptional regulator [Tetragenococcus koreensis]|uniref:LacI family DNA-binding transcriptional regulator n=1 Tax=Tetragenococcus koreensis TaxID=290335 RepID=UPI001F3B6ADC|nr:LacI family DNA-binding transcriptional regulator [Tetragenococcus koreensis]MDN6640323.1 LacI family transcriptional regulator [Tetragenococcus sp.]MDN6729797.1 LacI family transcriptional regulator [Alkalibacterium sp.]MCF1586199.1 LacI family transcriptional regulator [Tetragenococcus koreensis]MCF1615785.1 LacI family transcriptional regulator [Tetragenococcus koreensis]MCF1620711.1 LacI family transcriptional regulator [Tetragenococcus koreensis]